MARLAGILVVLSLAAGSCGDGEGNDPVLCDMLASAALKCTFSGFTERTVGELRSSCLEGDPGSECALRAYENSCASYEQLFSAVKACE